MKNIYISSYNEDGGIYRYSFDGGKLSFIDKVSLDSPMYTVIKDGKLWVLLRETDKETKYGGIMSFDISETGELVNPSSTVSTNGICPCHLCATDSDIYYVNYLSGNIVSLGGKSDMHSGSGINLPRQDMPHTHYVNLSPDKKYLLSCDLGLDCVYTYDFGLNVKSVAHVPAGHGPRHLDYSEDGRLVYCLNELKSTVSVFGYDNGVLTLLDTYPCIDENTADSTAAAIRVHKGYVYASNRGEDSVACFKISGDKLEYVSSNKVLGATPRDFDFCGDHIICTNENSDNVTVFHVDKGSFTKTDEIKGIKNPACVTVY